MIYLASPYTDPDPAIMQQRYDQVLEFAAKITQTGKLVYSPIVHYHPMASRFDLPREANYWERANKAMLGRARTLWIYQLEGWDTSVGVNKEIEWAVDLWLPVVKWEQGTWPT